MFIFAVMEDKLIKWLKSKKEFLNVRSIEENIGIPQGTLNKFLLDKGNLPDHWKPKVTQWIKKFKN